MAVPVAGPSRISTAASINWPRGRVLGGSSAINGLLYVRGQAQDYDVWRQLGNAGWSHRDVLPYFKKAEGQIRGADELHGGDGPLGVDDVRMDNPLCEAFLESCVADGLPLTTDFNGAVAGRRRLLSADQQAWPALFVGGRPICIPFRSRRNLHVITHAMTERVLLDGRRAIGVEARSRAHRRRSRRGAK